MVWARLDDAILDNEKIAAAGVFGFALHVAAITWCCRNLTDGHIPFARTGSLLALDAVHYDHANPLAISGGPRSMGGDTGLDAHVIADHLVEIGLWIRTDTGYLIHDFLEYNPSKEEVLSKREGAKERKKTRDSQKAAGKLPRSSREPDANLQSSSQPPDPDPVTNSPSLRSGETRAREGKLFPLVSVAKPNKGIQTDVVARFRAGVEPVTKSKLRTYGWAEEEKLLVAITEEAASNDEAVVLAAAELLGAQWASVERGKCTIGNFLGWLSSRNSPNSVYGPNAGTSKRRLDIGHAHQASKEDYVDDWGDTPRESAS